MHKDVARVAVLLACIALATSRFGLVAHELIGHGGTALALGATVTGSKLFWFAGGWIRYRGVTDLAPALVIAMAGIGVEFVCGAALWCLLTGNTPGRRLARAIGAALVVHASWYLATGAWHGFGDGDLLYRVLGWARAPVAIAAGLVTCAAAFAGAREAFGVLVRASGSVSALVIAILLAGGLNAALAIGELRLRRDVTYAAVMTTERDRTIAIELERYRQQRPQATEDERAAEQARLEREHSTFPFAWLLGIATALAIFAGVWRARPAPMLPITWRHVTTAATAAACGLGLVIALAAIL